MPIVQVDHQRAGRGRLTSGLKKAARGQGRALGGQSCVVAPTGRSSHQEMDDGTPPSVPVCISGRDGGGMTVEPLQHSLPQMRMGLGVRGKWSLLVPISWSQRARTRREESNRPNFPWIYPGICTSYQKPLYQLPTKHLSLLKTSESSFAPGSFLSYIGWEHLSL